MDLKRWLFKQWWRVNKARGVISMFFWVFTLVGVWLPYLERWTGLQARVLLPVALVVGGVLVLFVGYLWDRLRLWELESEQAMYRNYASWKPTPKERYVFLPLRVAEIATLLRVARATGLPPRYIRPALPALLRYVAWLRENELQDLAAQIEEEVKRYGF